MKLKLFWNMPGGVITEEVSTIGDVTLDRNAMVITFKTRTDDPNYDVVRHVPLRSLWEWQVNTR